MSLLFISDLHLSQERPEITRAFFAFLDQEVASAKALYILGDLVEAWIGDDDPSPLARELIKRLRDIVENGTNLYFLHGNRDFLVGKRFALETGATLLPDYYLVEDQDQKVLVCHGDTLCQEDKNYQKFRSRVRNPVYRWLLNHLPLKKRQRIASEWRAKSMAANSNKPDNIMDVTTDAVEQAFQEYDVKLMIHGHTHRPGVYQHSNGERIVLGDWHSHGWYVRMEGDQVQLVDFPIEKMDMSEVISNPTPEQEYEDLDNKNHEVKSEYSSKIEVEVASLSSIPSLVEPEQTDNSVVKQETVTVEQDSGKGAASNSKTQLSLDF